MDFSKNVITLHNQVRGLSPHPTAFFEIQKSNGEILPVKVYKSSYEETPIVLTHALYTDQKNILKISGRDGFLNLLEVIFTAIGKPSFIKIKFNSASNRNR